MRTLVLGAGGHIGNAILRELRSRHYRITAAGRKPQQARNLRGLQLELAPGDETTPGQFAAWVQGHDLVIDAAAPYPVHSFHPETAAEREPLAYAAARTTALLDAVAAANAKLAYIGSFTTLTPAGTLQQLHPYFAVKNAIERQLLAAAADGMAIIILNPSVCFGPWDCKQRSYCLIPQALGGELAAVTDHIVNIIDVRDVARALAQALEAGCYGKRFALCGHNIPVSGLIAEICRIGGARPPRLRASTTLSAAAAYWAEAAWALVGRSSPFPALPLLLLCASHAMQPTADQQWLGIRPRPLQQTLRAAIDWYRRLGYC